MLEDKQNIGLEVFDRRNFSIHITFLSYFVSNYLLIRVLINILFGLWDIVNDYEDLGTMVEVFGTMGSSLKLWNKKELNMHVKLELGDQIVKLLKL